MVNYKIPRKFWFLVAGRQAGTWCSHDNYRLIHKLKNPKKVFVFGGMQAGKEGGAPMRRPPHKE